jgi:glycosyltransferase involved in cell wall biosynthesis
VILIVANTIIGKHGNIGFRLGKVFQNQSYRAYYILARGIVGTFHGKSFGVFGHISRIINGFRRYMFPHFNSRRYDIFLFNLITIFYYYLHRLREREIAVVYLCETSIFLAKFFKNRNLRVVLDVPIAPSFHLKKVMDRYSVEGLKFNTYLNNQEIMCYQIVDAIITPSEYVKGIISEIAPSKEIFVVPFGVDNIIDKTEQFECDRIFRETTVFGFLGNISPRKGCCLLLEAWLKSGELENYRLIMQGRIYPGVIRRRVVPSIEIRGFSDKRKFFGDIDVLILPSLMEGSAKVIYEAIAHGVPVFASEYSGAPYFDNVGIFPLPIVNDDELRQALENIARSAPLRLSKSYIDNFTSFYSWERYRERILSILQ